MINHEQKFIFIHIPKTAGHTIELSLARLFSMKREEYNYWNNEINTWDQHLTLSEIKDTKVTDWQFREYFKFCIIRNPWDRVISEIAWHSKYGPEFISGKMTLKKFLSKKITHDLSTQRHIIPQYDFLYDKNGNLLCDFIGRFENLQQDFDFVCDKIGIPKQELPKSNKSEHKHYTEYYDNETREIVAEKYAKDIEHFGYKFGE